MSRLTVRTRYGCKFIGLPPYVNAPDKNKLLSDAANKLAAYEDAEEQGLLVKLPCKVGDTVFVIADCEDVLKHCDDDYDSGTGAVECPFESSCEFEDCFDSNRRVFEVDVTGYWIDDNEINIFFSDLTANLCMTDIGKSVFLTREDTERALAEEQK